MIRWRTLLSVVLALGTASAPAQTTLPFTGASISGGGGNTPTFVQGVGSDLNDNNGITGNGFIFNLPNATLSGNAFVLAIAYPYSATRTVAISDSCGDTWPAATITQGAASNGNMNVKVYVLPNASACAHTLTVTFDAAVKPFQYTWAEFYNIATSSAADGSKGVNSVGGTVAAAGSYTPTTNNDANGGHLIWAYAISNDAIGTLANNQASTITKTGGVSPSFMHANNICTIPSASSFDVQATNGAVNPGFNFTQSSGTNFVVASVALKAASAGTAPGSAIRVKRLMHLSVVNPVSGNNVLMFPADGNLLVASMAAGNNLNSVNSVTDSQSQSYTNPGTAGNSQVFYHQNAASGNNLTLTVNLNGAGQPQFSIHLWDVVGAQASSFLNTAGFNGAAPGTGNVVNDLPTITPNAAPGLVIVQTGFGTGPTNSLASGAPAGALFDQVYYTGMTDQDRMDNADAFGHVNYSTTAVQHWNWGMDNAARGSTIFATGIAFQ